MECSVLQGVLQPSIHLVCQKRLVCNGIVIVAMWCMRCLGSMQIRGSVQVINIHPRDKNNSPWITRQRVYIGLLVGDLCESWLLVGVVDKENIICVFIPLRLLSVSICSHCSPSSCLCFPSNSLFPLQLCLFPLQFIVYPPEQMFPLSALALALAHPPIMFGALRTTPIFAFFRCTGRKQHKAPGCV